MTRYIFVEDLTAVAFTYGPGLPFSLAVGTKKAKQLFSDYKLPLIPVNHMAGHALIARLTERMYSTTHVKFNYNDGANITVNTNVLYLLERPVNFPFLTLLISGGHTQLVGTKMILL